MKDKIGKELDKLEKRLLVNSDADELENIVNLFNLNLQKKNIIRNAKLSEVQDRVVEQMCERLEKRADSFSNDDLIKYHKTIQETIIKTDTTLNNVSVPNIQINQQVNVDSITLDSDSRKRVLSAVTELLNADKIIDNNDNNG